MILYLISYINDKKKRIYTQKLSNDNELIILFGAITDEDENYDKYTVSNVMSQDYPKYGSYIESTFSNPFVKVLIKNLDFDYENGIKIINNKIKERNE